jgi:hypothetical protein
MISSGNKKNASALNNCNARKAYNNKNTFENDENTASASIHKYSKCGLCKTVDYFRQVVM